MVGRPGLEPIAAGCPVFLKGEQTGEVGADSYVAEGTAQHKMRNRVPHGFWTPHLAPSLRSKRKGQEARPDRCEDLEAARRCACAARYFRERTQAAMNARASSR